MAGDVEGVGGEIDPIVEPGARVGCEEFADDGVEGFDPDVPVLVF